MWEHQTAIKLTFAVYGLALAFVRCFFPASLSAGRHWWAASVRVATAVRLQNPRAP